MEPNKSLPDDVTTTGCTWCSAPLGQNVMPAKSAKLFCSRRCEIEGTFWLYTEMCAIEITLPPNRGERDRNKR